MQRHYAKPLHAALTASLVLMAIARAALAGPLEDALAARDRGDGAMALRLFQPLADQGNAEAQYNLGNIYIMGQGVPKNDAEAAKWFRFAADQGYAPAQYNLGVLFGSGWGVPQNYGEAAKWYRLALIKVMPTRSTILVSFTSAVTERPRTMLRP